MERLTTSGITYNFASLNISEIMWLEKVQKRLAAYEDTGMEPEEVEHLKSFFVGGIHHISPETQRMLELTKADKDGRLVVLPCKVGDTVYISGHRFAAQIDEIVIGAEGGITINWSEYDRGPEETELWDDGWFEPEAFGKTVFFTNEEAEEALNHPPNRGVSHEKAD